MTKSANCKLRGGVNDQNCTWLLYTWYYVYSTNLTIDSLFIVRNTLSTCKYRLSLLKILRLHYAEAIITNRHQTNYLVEASYAGTVTILLEINHPRTERYSRNSLVEPK